MIHIARRMNRLGTETAFEVLAKARALEAQGKHIIHLEIGEPDFDTPMNIKQAAKKALDDGFTHYGPAAGLPQSRAAVARYVSETRGIEVLPEHVVVTPGAKPILFFIILACIDEDDEVIYPNPGFPIYESAVEFVGGKAIPLVLKEEKEFSFDIEDLERLITKKTRMLILNSPQNPTGGVLTESNLSNIADLARKHNLIVLSDEIYGRIMYDGHKHYSIASLPGMQERTVILDGFSKTFAMTGWRLGYGVMPEGLAKLVTRLQINSTSCTSSFSQIAGIEALAGPQHDVEKMVQEFKRRRDTIVEGLNSIPGIRCHKPHGAFYVFPNITGTGKTSKELADLLLNDAGVACLSGTAFGKHGEGYLRFSYANSIPNIGKALERIAKTLKQQAVAIS
ncbi:MAG: pyridoxal phosphate-dependent aminotransferase [Ignavibacteria bacterium]|nr:pyridoxal phosphate-dependent aminotransferase [Ignavibacteria bacterium]MBI3764938.1 pyridoxal phosphate-dependent aminotransferase [Ignavibacteriales bacterium]